MSLSPRARRGLVVLGAITLLLAVVIVVPREGARSREPFDPFAAVPRSTTALALVDVQALARSSLHVDWSHLEPTVPGAHSVATLCRSDPLRSIERIVAFVPKARGASASDLGLVGVGSIDADALIDCAERVLRARGRAPVRSMLDSFHTVRPSDGAGMEIAVRDGGPLLVGGGPVLHEMIDAIAGRAPNVTGTDLHRITLAGSAAHPVAASVVLDPHWLENVGAAASGRSPLSDVRSASFAVDPAAVVRVAAELRCATPAAATAVADTLAALGHSIAGMMHAEYGLSPDDASVAAEGTSVRIAIALRPDAAERLLGAIFAGDAPVPTP